MGMPSISAPPSPPPAPPQPTDPAVHEARRQAARKARARAGFQSTILTSSKGVGNRAALGSPTMLGAAGARAK